MIFCLGSSFQTSYICKPIFENPYHRRVVGWGPCSCMLYCENYFKLDHVWEDRNMMYTLDLIVVSIGIIEFFHLVSILTFLVYSYICMYVCSHFKEYQFQLVSNFHTYICFICAYYIHISLSTNLVYDDKLELQLCFNWFSFQLVS